jgi:four helix bundle protein
MNSYKDLEIYRIAFALAVRVHIKSLKLPKFELYEQGSQIRRSSKSIKDQIAEGFGRRRYKAEYIRFLIFAHASNDEACSQLEILMALYPEMKEFESLCSDYDILGRKINRYIDYVENNWKT